MFGDSERLQEIYRAYLSNDFKLHAMTSSTYLAERHIHILL